MRGLAYDAGYRGTVNALYNPNQERSDPSMASRIIPEYPESGQPPKIITCTDGTEVLIDAEDYPLLSRHGWYINWSVNKPYCITKLKTDQSNIWRCIFIHHLILGTAVEIDHKDGNTLNNQKHNLRPATRQENGWNSKKRLRGPGGRPPTSLYKGVSKTKNAKGEVQWRVLIKLSKKGEVPNRHYRSPPFKTELEAALFYNEKVVELRGKFAYLNVIDPTESKDGETK
jgi:hypothetical protein